MTRSDERIRLHELRQLAFGELAEPAATDLRARLRDDPSADDRLRRLRRDLDLHDDQPSLDRISIAVVDALDAPRSGSSRWGSSRSGSSRSGPSRSGPSRSGSSRSGSSRSGSSRSQLVLAAALGLSVIIPASLLRPSPGPPTRIKGLRGPPPSLAVKPPSGHPGPTLEMFVKDATGIRPGTDGMRLHDGDWVQFRYHGAGRRFVFVVSVDDDGVIAPLYPDHPGASVAIYPEGRHVLEGSVILDDAVGPERIFAFFSFRPLRFDELAGGLRRIDDPAHQVRAEVPSADVDQVSILIYKERR